MRRGFQPPFGHSQFSKELSCADGKKVINITKSIARQIKHKAVPKRKAQSDLLTASERLSFKEYLLTMPDVGPDRIFARRREAVRRFQSL